MAKWGEGDPRWIVEERPDAVNVNNWHWTEKDATKWSETTMKELLCGLKIEGEVASVKITEVESMEGEASVNNRKAKLIYLYDWNITLKWEGRLAGGSELCEGKMSIPNLSDENDPSEVTIEVSLKESTDDGEAVKDYLHHQGKEVVRQQLVNYLKLLKEEFSKGVILPKKDGADNENKPNNSTSNLNKNFDKKLQLNNTSSYSSEKSNNFGPSSETGKISESYKFQCTAEDFFRSLTDSKMAEMFTRAQVVMNPQEGGRFELYDGNVSGIYLQLVAYKKIVQSWRLKSWPEGYYSTVTIDIDQRDDHTAVKLTQTGVPNNLMDNIKNNWEFYYWNRLKRTFGWGCFL